MDRTDNKTFTVNLTLEVSAPSGAHASDMVSEMLNPAMPECGNEDRTVLTDWRIDSDSRFAIDGITHNT